MHIKNYSYFLLVFLFSGGAMAIARDLHTNKFPDAFLPMEDCLPEDKMECQNLKSDVHILWEKLFTKNTALLRDQINEDSDKSLLQLNRAIELLHFYTEKAQPNNEPYFTREQILSKYRQLLKINGSFARTNSPDETRSFHPQVVYHPLEVQAVHDVLSRFGPLEIPHNEISSSNEPQWYSVGVESPWAGYWYPKYDRILYYQDDSVMAKFDRIMQRLGQGSNAQEFERNLLSGILPESWEGLCNAWSLASIQYAEPNSTIFVKGEALEISDQKALLTKMHENSSVDMFGIRYNGDYSTDGTYQDLRPEAFHKLFQIVLGNRKQAMIIDEAADAEVWQKPIYKVDWTVSTDPDIADAIRVQARAWKIEPRWSVSNILTSRSDIGYHDYVYRLYIDPEFLRQHNRLMVIAGEWLGDSRRNHPDYVVIPSHDSEPQSFNPSINQNMELLQSILRGEVDQW